MSIYSSSKELLSLDRPLASAAPSTQVMLQLASALETRRPETGTAPSEVLPAVDVGDTGRARNYSQQSDSHLINNIMSKALTPADPLKAIDWSQAQRFKDQPPGLNDIDGDFSKHHRQQLGVGSQPEADKPPPLVPRDEASTVYNRRFLTGLETALCAALVAGAISRARGLDGRSTNGKKPQRGNKQINHIENDGTRDGDEACNTKPHKSAPGRSTYLMNQTESLNSLALKYFGDESISHLIADLNSSVLSESTLDGKRIIELAAGQKICLPDNKDIAAFTQQDQALRPGSDLVTVITQRPMQKQLLDAVMGRALGLGAGRSTHDCTIMHDLVQLYPFAQGPSPCRVFHIVPRQLKQRLTANRPVRQTPHQYLFGDSYAT